MSTGPVLRSIRRSLGELSSQPVPATGSPGTQSVVGRPVVGSMTGAPAGLNPRSRLYVSLAFDGSPPFTMYVNAVAGSVPPPGPTGPRSRSKPTAGGVDPYCASTLAEL